MMFSEFTASGFDPSPASDLFARNLSVKCGLGVVFNCDNPQLFMIPKLPQT